MVLHSKNRPFIQNIHRLDLFSISIDGEREYKSESLNQTYLRTKIPEFPCLMYGDGRPWSEGNTYLLESVCQRISFSVLTLRSIANDLLRFLRFLVENEIDFKSVPKRKPAYPIHRFHYDLNVQVESELLVSATANRCLGQVQRFYDWMISEKIVSEEFSSVASTKTWGRRRFNYQQSKNNVAEKSALHALSFEEQKTLVTFLKTSKNIEMRLVFATALLTGMRMQSVLTLKKHIFTCIDISKADSYSITIGYGTGIDSKFGTNIVINFPYELMFQLKVYCESARAVGRRSKGNSDCYDEYIFLNNRGKPYYISQYDRLAEGNDCFNTGGAVRKYLRDVVIPKTGLEFNFHCTRATFAMNLVDSQLALVEAKKINLNQARNYVRERLGHTSSEVTDQYLNIRKYLVHTHEIQNEYESLLLDAL